MGNQTHVDGYRSTVKILSLNVRNFLTVGASSPPLSLDSRGLVLIQGDNQDDPSAKSNGAGKSTFPDALCWALYGVTARGVSGDAVINEKAKKNCFVTVRLQDGDIIYDVTRHRKDSIHKNETTIEMWPSLVVADSWAGGLKTSAPTLMAKATEKDTQEVIERIVGCSLQVFMASIYAGQEIMPDLPGMTDKELKTLIEEAAGVERLEKAYTLAKDTALKATTAVQIHDAAFDREKINRANIEASINAAVDKHATFEANRPVNAKQYADNVQALKGKIAANLDYIKKVDAAALNAELADISPKLAEGKVYEDRRIAMMGVVSAAQRDQAVAQNAITNAKAARDSIQKQIDNAEAQMAIPCPECGKPHTPEDLGQYKAAAITRRQAADHKLQQVEPALGICAATVKGAQDALQAFVATIPDLSAVAARVGVLNATLRDYATAKNNLVIIKKDIEAQIAASTTVMAATNPHAATIEAYKAQLLGADSKLADMAAKRVVLEAEQVMADNVVSVFSPAGVRAHILDTITPYLNERTALYLSQLSDGNISAVWSTLTTTAKGELREKFNIEVENLTGAKTFGGLSGGEKRKVRLATMLALQDLVATRAAKPIDLVIFDEIDHALDEAGLERLMGILETKAREHGTVLIISHNSLGDWCDQVLTVTKNGGISTISATTV